MMMNFIDTVSNDVCTRVRQCTRPVPVHIKT